MYVDTDTVLKPLLSGLAVDSNVQNRVGMMSRVLLSRPNMERVARETDLYLRTRSAQAFTALVESLPARITLEGNSRENVYTLRYSDAEPAMAQRVVQTLLDTFVEDTLGVKRADTDSAQSFLQEQIREYETRLRDAEDRLARFKKDNVGLMPGETGDYYTRLQTGLTRLRGPAGQVSARGPAPHRAEQAARRRGADVQPVHRSRRRWHAYGWPYRRHASAARSAATAVHGETSEGHRAGGDDRDAGGEGEGAGRQAPRADRPEGSARSGSPRTRHQSGLSEPAHGIESHAGRAGRAALRRSASRKATLRGCARGSTRSRRSRPS